MRKRLTEFTEQPTAYQARAHGLTWPVVLSWAQRDSLRLVKKRKFCVCSRKTLVLCWRAYLRPIAPNNSWSSSDVTHDCRLNELDTRVIRVPVFKYIFWADIVTLHSSKIMKIFFSQGANTSANILNSITALACDFNLCFFGWKIMRLLFYAYVVRI